MRIEDKMEVDDDNDPVVQEVIFCFKKLAFNFEILQFETKTLHLFNRFLSFYQKICVKNCTSFSIH